MALQLRFVGVCAALLLAHASAAAQPAVAPEPHLAPRKSKPGSVESLIDDLTEYWSMSPSEFGAASVPAGERERGEAPYWKVAELGFEAIPTLLEHLHDKRFTRLDKVRVGHVAGWLLADLLDGVPDSQEASDYWEKVQKVGEEKWLTDHVLPRFVFDGEKRYEAGGAPNRVIARAMGAKYPARLADAYLKVLRERIKVESDGLAKAIATSKLSREKKLALLEEGAAHKLLVHRHAALDALADLDKATFHKNLIATLKWLPSDIEGTSYWMCPEANLVGLVRKTDDPACWDALAATARRVSVGLRMEMLGYTRYAIPADQERVMRREQLRFLVGFLADEATRGNTPPPGKEYRDFSARDQHLQVRNYAARLVACDLAWYRVRPDLDCGPMSRLFIRAAVAKAAEEELARLKK